MTDRDNSWPDNPFWDYSLSVYGKDGIADAFLELQDSVHADVNILLYCCWVGVNGGRRLDDNALKEIIDRVKFWQSEVVSPLRAVRNAMKSNPANSLEPISERLRSRIKNCELEAERVEQLLLFQAYPVVEKLGNHDSTGLENVQANLELYIGVLTASISQKNKKNISKISQAAI